MYVVFTRPSEAVRKQVPWLNQCKHMLALVVAEALETLVSKRLSNKITVTFKFCYQPNVDWHAIVEYTDNNFRPREYDMVFNMAKFNEPWEMYIAACHETVHIKQYAKNELYQYSRRWRTLRWKNEIFTWHFKLTPEEEMAFPWEIEAYALEDELFLNVIKKALPYVRT